MFFDDVNCIAHRCAQEFQGAVMDGFGHSVMSEVFEPILQNINCLIELEESSLIKINKINDDLAELRSIVGSGNV